MANSMAKGPDPGGLAVSDGDQHQDQVDRIGEQPGER
jgi:hypothetical protein